MQLSHIFIMQFFNVNQDLNQNVFIYEYLKKCIPSWKLSLDISINLMYVFFFSYFKFISTFNMEPHFCTFETPRCWKFWTISLVSLSYSEAWIVEFWCWRFKLNFDSLFKYTHTLQSICFLIKFIIILFIMKFVTKIMFYITKIDNSKIKILMKFLMEKINFLIVIKTKLKVFLNEFFSDYILRVVFSEKMQSPHNRW
jgi:hypothetical protein